MTARASLDALFCSRSLTPKTMCEKMWREFVCAANLGANKRARFIDLIRLVSACTSTHIWIAFAGVMGGTCLQDAPRDKRATHAEQQQKQRRLLCYVSTAAASAMRRPGQTYARALADLLATTKSVDSSHLCELDVQVRAQIISWPSVVDPQGDLNAARKRAVSFDAIIHRRVHCVIARRCC